MLNDLQKSWWTTPPRSNPATGLPSRRPPRLEPLVRALYATILERGGYPYPLLDLTDQDEILFAVAKDEQLDATPPFRKLAYDQFESRIRIHSATNPRALSGVDPARQRRRQKSLAPILEAQMRRGADRSFKWVTTLFPTEGFAAEAGMSLRNFEDFVYRACHADEPDPVAFWKKVEASQRKIIDRIEGHDQVILRGPNVDLTLSIQGRKFLNGAGLNNMPDGEIYTGPVEDSVNGWVRFSYPAIYNGVMVEGVELTFTNGKVTKAKADKNQAFLLEMCESDHGRALPGRIRHRHELRNRPLLAQHPVRRETWRYFPHGARFGLSGNRQQEQEHDPLGYDLRHERRLRDRPGWRSHLQEREIHLLDKIKRNKPRFVQVPRRGGFYGRPGLLCPPETAPQRAHIFRDDKGLRVRGMHDILDLRQHPCAAR